MLKKLVLFVAAVMLLASSAQAAKNNIYPFTDSPVIVKGACSQAGKLVLEFGNSTQFNSTMPAMIGRLSEGATLCKPVDLYIRVPHAAALENSPDGPVQGQYSAYASGGAGHVVIHVVGSVGSREITITALSGALASNGTGVNLVLFDGKAAQDRLIDGSKTEYDPSANTFTHKAGVTNSNASALDNVLCIQASADYAKPEVKIYMESGTAVGTDDTTHAFSPADSVIAIPGSRSIGLFASKNTRTAKIGDPQTACNIDYLAGTGLCQNTLTGNVALTSGVDFGEGIYSVELELKVNGLAGDHGVFFAAGSTGVGFVKNIADTPGAWQAGTVESYVAGSTTKQTPSVYPTCSSFEEKVVKVVEKDIAVTKADQLGKRLMKVGIPGMVFDKTVVKPGDKVSLQVTVRKGACTVLISEEQFLFSFVKDCKDEAAASGSLLFPYFADAPFWNGMALTNTGSAPVNATLAIVDAKGGEGTIEVMVPAKGMYVSLVESIVADSAFNGTVNPKERCYIVVTPQSGSLVGFAMMGNAGESMGYTVNN